MNYVALIGIIKSVEKENTPAQALLKVQKCTATPGEEKWYELVAVKIPPTEFEAELKEMKAGDVVGVKGRISQNKVIAERIQIF
ncbi:MAG: hypothetical protein LBV53_01315 [Mycoplasmataceae bacterium]|nr:hypothetical protein [Mycoplasmataceae bacterium]